MKRLMAIAAVGAVAACGLIWAQQPAKEAAGVVSITLPVMEPNLPAGPGRETVLATCVICHSTRYITMQPPMPRAAWAAGVDKMRKIYGAPITDPQAAEVVNYLVSIRGVDGAK